MKWLVPKSLLGQVMASVALALFAAQLVSAGLLYRASEERRESATITAAALRLIGEAERAERRAQARTQARTQSRAERRDARRDERRAQRAARRRGETGPAQAGPNQADPAAAAAAQSRPRSLEQIAEQRRQNRFDQLPRVLRYTTARHAPLTPLPQEGEREARLRQVLEREDITVHAASIMTQRAGEDPALQRFAANRPMFQRDTGWQDRTLLLASIQREAGGRWETARVVAPDRAKGVLSGLITQTLVTFVLLIAILYFVLRRITRPLGILTERVSDFSQRPELASKLEESGPADTRRLIAAYNAMETRIAAMLDEKDVMLGAIGHDLKTPLAALRVRIESVADDDQRGKMAAGIEDITATLDDILALARVGRDSNPEAHGAEAVDLGALASAIAAEFEDLGQPVEVIASERLVARVQVTWIKRALRNLISNAVRYGGGAQISVIAEHGAAILRVEDDGPGIPEARIADMFEPFTRGENSRNRATGGTGLGLTLARAIAQQHGGDLELENRASGGLRAQIRLPIE